MEKENRNTLVATEETNLEKVISIVEKIRGKEVFCNRDNLKSLSTTHWGGILGWNSTRTIEYDRKGRSRKIIENNKLKQLVKIDDKKQKAIVYKYDGTKDPYSKQETTPNGVVVDMGFNFFWEYNFPEKLYDILMDIKYNGDLSPHSVADDGTIICNEVNGTTEFQVAENIGIIKIVINEFNFDYDLVNTTSSTYVDGELVDIDSTRNHLNIRVVKNNTKNMVYYLKNNKPYICVKYEIFNGRKRPLKIVSYEFGFQRRCGKPDSISIYKYYDKE